MFNYANSKYTNIYIESLVKYVVSVIDYNISLFRTVSRSNYAIIDYTMLQSASIVIFRNGIFHWPVKLLILFSRFPYMVLPSSLLCLPFDRRETYCFSLDFFFRFRFFSAKLVRTITFLSFEIGQWYFVCGCMTIRWCVAYRNDLCGT